MQHYEFEIEAGDDFPDWFAIDFLNYEAACEYAISLASVRLQTQADAASSMVVRILIRDAQGEILATLHSVAEPS